jgi:hypothetical protein
LADSAADIFPIRKEADSRLRSELSAEGNKSTGRKKQPRIHANFHEYLPDHDTTVMKFSFVRIRMNSWLISHGFITPRQAFVPGRFFTV